MKVFLTSYIVIISSMLAFSQEMVFSTISAAKKVGIQDPFEVQYVIKNGKNIQSFSLPTLKDFQVLDGPSKSTRISDFNGDRTVTVELTYVFRARKTGQLIIPGGIAVVDGREIKSNQVEITVINGSVIDKQAKKRNAFPNSNDPFLDMFDGEDPFAAMQQQHQKMMQMLQQQMQQGMPQSRGMQAPSQQQAPELISRNEIANNLFIKVDVDKKNVTIGEQITVSYKLYTRMPMEVNLTKLPMLNGFWSQDFKLPQPPKPVKEIYNGKEYQVFEIKRTALFPTQTGTLVLDEAVGEGVARLLKSKKVKQEDYYKDDPFFNSFFGSMMMNDPDYDNQYLTTYNYEDVPVKLKSAPINIQVHDIPITKRPSSFNGAVGVFNFESNIDKTELSTDDMATITLKVTGTGNLKLIGAPSIQFPEDLDGYDPKISDTITNTDNIIAGYKTFSYAFAPRYPGNYTIPAIAFTYFDPNTKEFKSLNTPSYTIHVKAGKSDGQSVKNKLPKDIHDINAVSTKIEKNQSIVLPQSAWYWSGFLFPLLTYFGLIAYRKKEDELQSNTTLFKHKRANKIAMKRLAQAEKYLKKSDKNAFYEETSKAVWIYISDKLSIALASLSKDLASQKLTEKNISVTLQSELFRITDECEMALYSPEKGTMKMHQTYADALKLIGKLEDELA